MDREDGRQLTRLVDIMARLRTPGGCDWDREQDLRSLRPYLLEEAHEVLEEMDQVAYGGPWQPLCEELGDLLFQIVFHSQLAGEAGQFGMADVCRAIADKIERRHPHVFGDATAKGSAQVLANWARLKADERRAKTGRAGSALAGVPQAAPGLMRAERLTEKASRIGFDWPDLAGVRGKLQEELDELDEAITSGDRDALEHELGDVLFSLANLARFIDTPPEDALRQAIRRFTDRFHHIEAGLEAAQVPFGAASLDQMEGLWQEAKGQEAAIPPPRHPPRAALLALEVPVADPEAGAEVWEALLPALGWARVEKGRPAFRYTDGVSTLTFTARPGATPPRLTLEAPSERAVAAIAGKAGALPVGALEHQPGRLTFTDPAGVAWEYKTSLPTERNVLTVGPG